MIGQIMMDNDVAHVGRAYAHTPVMLHEILEYLQPGPGDVVVDGTLGMGGHARAMLEIMGPTGKLIGIDRDGQSLQQAKANLRNLEHQCYFVQDDFRNIDKVLKGLGFSQVDQIILDLGISSFQLDNPGRGFSLKEEGPLDMRMDQDSYIAAYDLINSLSEKELATIIRDFGEERFANRIARSIVYHRAKHPIETTTDLASVVLKGMPRGKWQHIHPATRTFQAFRIAVNRELESLNIVIRKCFDVLKVNGRMAVIAFHSLEDRIVKEQFRELAKNHQALLLTKKPLRPTDEEVAQNPRARSARLRVAERIAYETH